MKLRENVFFLVVCPGQYIRVQGRFGHIYGY